MDSDKLLERLKGYLTMEQEFHHQKVTNGCKKLGKEELEEIIDIVHTNYLVKAGMFKRLVEHCVRRGYKLPPMSDLFNEP